MLFTSPKQNGKTKRQKRPVLNKNALRRELKFNSLKIKILKVASTGIEPVSGASETLILSIVLRGPVTGRQK